MSAISEPIALDRTRFLGGTDMAALYGVSKWKTPLQVWAEKTRRDAYREDDPAKTKVLNRGKRLEPVVVASASAMC
ncbi:YqaJ viral recombinase family protein [Achromobacter xylosoxidans]